MKLENLSKDRLEEKLKDLLEAKTAKEAKIFTLLDDVAIINGKINDIKAKLEAL